ncbi:hypothetical protein DM02DRAFT_608559 [Periconia macrospinosa]|uniref:Uncharacterized protein n=1 Tax=Periconia macrospinosa TaxID=97972 RepID=A0A2V1ECA7_9PLEO|nr:hypothetical protein DM02DRAFT_608559 [Periconia macrospinosa]
MKDQQQYSKPVSPRDLSTRLRRIKKSNSFPNDGDAIARFSHRQRTGTSSSSSSSNTASNSMDISRLPAFTKSATTSTSGSDESNGVGRLRVMRTEPLTRTQLQSVEIAPGNFSKPRLEGARKRRAKSSSSTTSKDEFQYYGRHANSWLFNDFSISGTVRKGFGKVFSSRGEEEDEVEKPRV